MTDYDPEYDDICTDKPYWRIEKIEYMYSHLSTWVIFIDSDGIERRYTNLRWSSMARLERAFRQLDITVKFDERLPIITAHRETRNWVQS